MQDSQSGCPVVIELGDIRDTKLKLIKLVARLINKKYSTQKKAASALNIDQPKVSQINRAKIEGFSLEYLINLLVVLGQDVNVKIKHSSETA
ncbi:helix-turn-helix domain-containing protein [Wolbachia endosymbiont of Folsomia candida]|uniref:helix-turn-helix domain-containing protein n=1 Tax=Wolbachia endosymbiont of Folsomia candida TaxID=169402 RepID=UPI000B1F156E|nr:XRE family transcriptional regulator [Wolbachia endosymbiont of Folsomia candida]APR98099.1 DNA-binding protein [Wolbachia endosymbiont of Folsomia candida]